MPSTRAAERDDVRLTWKSALPLPPLPEQKKIAAILSSVDEAIQATEAVIEQTRRVKDGLLQDLLTRGIGHSRFKQTEIGEIPESWEVQLLDTVGSREVAVTHRASDILSDRNWRTQRWVVTRLDSQALRRSRLSEDGRAAMSSDGIDDL